ncbi:MAG TPA: GAF domain-containing protein, partial [Anaerolineales bacterium]|nr:GAF domain-containing protein [Anaerolineales bacterium]
FLVTMTADSSIRLPDQSFAAVFSGTAVLVWSLDSRGRVTVLEGDPEIELGCPIEDALGRPYSLVFSTFPDLVRTIESSLHGESQHVNLSNQGRTWEVRLIPVVDEGGIFCGINAAAFDVTELKEKEASLQAQKQLFENLVAIARATAERLNLDDTLDTALRIAADLTRAELGSVFLINESGEVIQSILARGMIKSKARTGSSHLVMSDGLAGWVVRNQKAVLILDTQDDDRWLTIQGSFNSPRSALSVPIMSSTRVVGVLTLTHSSPGHFDHTHLDLLQAAADQMALSLINAQLYDEQRRLADFQLTLYRVLRKVGSHLDPGSVAQVAVEEISRLTDWPAVAIALADVAEENLVIEAEAGIYVVGTHWSLPVGSGVIGRAYRSGEAQYVPVVGQDADYIGTHHEIQSELAIPLRRGEVVLGVLNIESDKPNDFSKNDVQLAESLADAVSLAFENARLFQDLKATTDRLRELDRLKSSFLANMSHELRTPLNAILGYSELLQEDAREFGIDDFAGDLDKIQLAGKHLLAVINDILNFSKIEAGRMDLFLETFDLRGLVDDVVTAIEPVFEKNRNRLVVKAGKGLGSITADPTKVRQILINLLSNATKFSEDGEIRLNVRRARKDTHDWAVFQVRDNGIGMTEKQLEYLFQPFIQGDISTTRKYGGTGLGLAITRGFCQLMAGWIEVKSLPGAGSTFTVWIPADVSIHRKVEVAAE